ncbi:hypothetical protein CPB85DRAFT_1312634 [Mucidula mucida]|nr:hypothetical protein CPB85DRAFT_1312634 [Mucidula mucida]
MGLAPWKVGVGLQLVLLVLVITTLALAARVNEFQEWFYACDIIIFTLALLSLLLVLLLTLPIVLSALNHSHAPIAYFLTTRFHIHRRMGVQTARILQLGAYAILGVFWLAGAAFGTSRWKGVPMKCPTVAEVDDDDAEAMVRWCNDLKALRVMVWVLWVGFLVAALTTVRAAASHRRETHGEFLQFDYETSAAAQEKR